MTMEEYLIKMLGTAQLQIAQLASQLDAAKKRIAEIEAANEAR